MRRATAAKRADKASFAPPSSATAASSSSSSLSLKRFVDLTPLDVDIETARQLVMKGKQITLLPQNLGVMLGEVRCLNLSENDIHDVRPLASMQRLTSLNLSKNSRLSSIAPLAELHLTVCVVAHCNLRSLAGLEGSSSTLKTLIANENNLVIQSPTGGTLPNANSDGIKTAVRNYEILSMLSGCETVVLSRNPQLCSMHYVEPTLNEEEEEEKEREKEMKKKNAPDDIVPHHEADWSHPLSVLEKMPHLKKISLSGCGLISLPSHWFLPMVTELRMSHNSLSSLIPEGVIFRSVKILDVSHNALTDIATLRRCRFVRQLSISGNPFLKENEMSPSKEGEEMRKRVHFPREVMEFFRRRMPHLEMVDSTLLSSIQSEDAVNESVSEGKDDDDVAAATVCEESTQKRAPSNTQERHEKIEDVVVETPLVEPEANKAPIVRRERTNLLEKRKRELIADGAAVAQLVMKRRTEVNGW